MTDTPDKSLHVPETCKENAGSFAIDEKALERAKEEAFNKVMGRNDMPSDVLPEYDRWLFDASIAEYLAAREEAGFVEVPREPTEEMFEAGHNQIYDRPYDATTNVDIGSIWDAMLAKAK